ncbi:MAG: Na/Pi cotransporter family protein, partial [Hyphomicrobiales bacterium]|nr:Na/Pi cotransporter family protein [Hyphomicrobiales bacterium]
LAVMLGADIGAAVAPQLFASGIAFLWSLLALAGYLIHTLFGSSSVKAKHIGRVLLGFAVLFLALKTVSAASGELVKSEILVGLLTAISSEPVLAILIGALLTWLVYSSLVMVLLVASLAASATMGAELFYPLILGINLGAALPALTATLADDAAVRRIPLGNFLFRLVGVVLAAATLNITAPLLTRLSVDPIQQIVNFHLAFNIGLAIVFIGLTGLAAAVAERIMPDIIDTTLEDDTAARSLDEGLFGSPQIALAMAARETLRIGDVIEAMLTKTMAVFTENDAALAREVERMDDQVDKLHEAIKFYLTRLTREELDDEESARAIEIISFTTNLEHIGDIIDKNLMDIAKVKIKRQLNFSGEGQRELVRMHAEVMETLRMALSVFMKPDRELARELLSRKEVYRTLELDGTQQHFDRLRSGYANSIETSAIHLDMIRDFKRINSHLTSVAYPILDRAGELRTSRLAVKTEKKSKSKKEEYKKSRESGKPAVPVTKT